MLFNIVPKGEFRKLVGIILESNEVIGPKLIDKSQAGTPIHQYLPIKGFEELDLGYENSQVSAKTYFIPYQEALSTFTFTKTIRKTRSGPPKREEDKDESIVFPMGHCFGVGSFAPRRLFKCGAFPTLPAVDGKNGFRPGNRGSAQGW